MTPDERNQFEQMKQELEELRAWKRLLEASATIPYEIDSAFRDRLGLSAITTINNAPQPAITAPSGGATQDTQARNVINNIITALETLGLLEPN